MSLAFTGVRSEEVEVVTIQSKRELQIYSGEGIYICLLPIVTINDACAISSLCDEVDGRRQCKTRSLSYLERR